VICPSAEISRLKWLVISALKFWKFKKFGTSYMKLKTKNNRRIDLNVMNESWNMLVYLYVHKRRCKKCYVSVIHDFYNRIFKTKRKFYTALGSAPSYEKFWLRPSWHRQLRGIYCNIINLRDRTVWYSDTKLPGLVTGLVVVFSVLVLHDWQYSIQIISDLNR